MWLISPSEFWGMTPREWWLVYDARVGEKRYGDLTETEVHSLHESLEEAISQNG